MSLCFSANFPFHKWANSICNVASSDQNRFYCLSVTSWPYSYLFPHHLPVFPGLSLPRTKVFSHLPDLDHHFAVCQRWLLWPALAAGMSLEDSKVGHSKNSSLLGLQPSKTCPSYSPSLLSGLGALREARHHWSADMWLSSFPTLHIFLSTCGTRKAMTALVLAVAKVTQ